MYFIAYVEAEPIVASSQSTHPSNAFPLPSNKDCSRRGFNGEAQKSFPSIANFENVIFVLKFLPVEYKYTRSATETISKRQYSGCLLSVYILGLKRMALSK
jgi:hypothetical protein